MAAFMMVNKFMVVPTFFTVLSRQAMIYLYIFAAKEIY
jgi:hypothetical protein